MRFSSVVICGPGKRRDENQDNFYLNGVIRSDPSDKSVLRIQNQAHDHALYAVADGMGGEQHGEIASWITVRELSSVSHTAGPAAVLDYLQLRNAELCRFIKSNGGARSGSTYVSISLNGKRADLVNIGDSRAYLFRKGALHPISRDHTVAARLYEFGTFTEEQMRTDPSRHRLTQHLGIFPEEMALDPYTHSFDIQDGDMFLLCSDGLYDMLDDGRIQRLLESSDSLPSHAAALFAAAMDAGGRDKITVLLVSVGESSAEEFDNPI